MAFYTDSFILSASVVHLKVAAPSQLPMACVRWTFIDF